MYTGHYANYPTHCPQWARLEASERLKIIEAIALCTKYPNPRYVHKTAGEMRKHIAQIRSIRKKEEQVHLPESQLQLPTRRSS